MFVQACAVLTLQEYLPGEAEDMALIADATYTRPVQVSAGNFSRSMVLTLEWSPLEPDAPFEHKVYVKGVGNILTQEIAPDGVREELVSYSVANATNAR